MLTASTSLNPLHQLKKNASRELNWVLMGGALVAFYALVFAHSVGLRWFATGVLAQLGVVGVIVYRRLRVIREMEQQHDRLYDFLQSRIARLRHLMRLHNYVSVAYLLLLALAVLLVRRADVLNYLQPTHPAWHWGVVGGVTAVVLAVIYGGYVTGKKEHQHRYGRFLDRLETALRELEAAA